MQQFFSLKIDEVRRETRECVSLTFDIPPEHTERFRYVQGQYLTLRKQAGSEEMRRSYSICSGLDENVIRIAVKEVPGGHISAWINRELKAGDMIDVAPPEGRFFQPVETKDSRHYGVFAAGSGITPILSIVKTCLAAEPKSRFTVIYGSRSVESEIFGAALEDLKDRYIARVALYRMYSRDPQEKEFFNGRLDSSGIARLVDIVFDTDSFDAAFVCGPETMMANVRAELEARGMPQSRIHLERFSAPVQRPLDNAIGFSQAPNSKISRECQVILVINGVRHEMLLAQEGPSVLEAALAAGIMVPYSCMGGVCSTCRAKLIEGDALMDSNYTLDDKEIASGFRLTCQSHPLTQTVILDFDQQ